MIDDDLVAAGAAALYGPGEEGNSLEAAERREGCRTLAEEILDAVEPLIRADERSRTPVVYERVLPDYSVLIAKVEALDWGHDQFERPTVLVGDVIALLRRGGE